MDIFRLEVYTPQSLFFSDDVQAVLMTLVDGEIVILANHSHVSAPVVPCLLRIREKDGNWKNAFISEGILEVTNHKTVVMSDSAEWAEEIDRDRAIKARDKALETIGIGMPKNEVQYAKQSLKRAECRIKVSKMAKSDTINST